MPTPDKKSSSLKKPPVTKKRSRISKHTEVVWRSEDVTRRLIADLETRLHRRIDLLERKYSRASR